MIAIITARGGSKELPRKNVLPLCGRPLISYTVEAAVDCPEIDRVIVSTDDQGIADAARAYGAEIPFIRPDYLATDDARSRDVVLHALDFLSGRDQPVQNFCLLQPTSPLRTAGDITNAVKLFTDRHAASVLSVVEYEHPIQWAVELGAEGKMKPHGKEAAGNRQEMQKYYRPNGAIYVFDVDFFKEAEAYVGPDSYAYVMPPERSVDIDTKIDFMLAEALLKQRGQDGN